MLAADDEWSGLAGKARRADPLRLDNYMTNSNLLRAGIEILLFLVTKNTNPDPNFFSPYDQ